MRAAKSIEILYTNLYIIEYNNIYIGFLSDGY